MTRERFARASTLIYLLGLVSSSRAVRGLGTLMILYGLAWRLDTWRERRQAREYARAAADLGDAIFLLALHSDYRIERTRS